MQGEENSNNRIILRRNFIQEERLSNKKAVKFRPFILNITYLQALDAARSRLLEVTRERSRVLDLVGHDPGTTRLPDPSDGDFNDDDGGGGTPEIDPLGSYTPEVDEALRQARGAIEAAKEARRTADEVLESVSELEQTVWQTVNTGLTNKVAETAKLKVGIIIGPVEPRHV